MKKFLVILLCACIGAMFILSAYFKLWPIEPFEYKIVGTTFFGWKLSVYVARIIIAAEFTLGLLLLSAYNLKSTLTMAIVLLSVFSIHLLYVLMTKGNASDCGCMGSLVFLTPIQGLFKNLAMIIACIIVYKVRFDYRFKVQYVPAYIFLITAVAVFIVNPVDFGHSKAYLDRPFETFELDLDTIYNAKASDGVEKPEIDIREKKTILAFVSSSCPHCKVAAHKLSVISLRNPSIPIYMFINGDQADIKTFTEQTETSHIPHSRLGRDLFIPLAGLKLPVIYYYNKGKIDKQVDYFTLEQYHIEEWLRK